MTISTLCIASLGLLVVWGGFYVSMCRNKERIIQGYPQDPSHYLHKAIRAHSNAVEYGPMLALLMMVAGQATAPGWIAIVMIVVTVARFMNYFGLVLSKTLAEPHPLRFLGSFTTYIGGTVLLVWLLVQGLGLA